MTRRRIVVEITPPRLASPLVLLRRARALGPVDAVDVIQRSDRLASLDAGALLADAGLTPVWHLVTRGRSEAEIRADLAGALLAALPAVLCLRGDRATADAADAKQVSGPTIRECVALARRALTRARVGVTLNPYLPGERGWKNLSGKLEAGAHFVRTQPIFEPGHLRSSAEAIGRSFPRVAVVPR